MTDARDKERTILLGALIAIEALAKLPFNGGLAAIQRTALEALEDVRKLQQPEPPHDGDVTGGRFWSDEKIAKAREDLLSLYNPKSLSYADGIYARSLVDKYQMSIDELQRIVGKPVVDQVVTWVPV